MESQELMPSRWPGLITTTAVIALTLCAIVVYRTSTGWRPHDKVSGPAPTLKLDPNVARWEELACLPQIGPSLARRIVEHRETKKAAGVEQPYRSEADLDEVAGIGPRTLEEIRPYLVFVRNGRH